MSKRGKGVLAKSQFLFKGSCPNFDMFQTAQGGRGSENLRKLSQNMFLKASLDILQTLKGSANRFTTKLNLKYLFIYILEILCQNAERNQFFPPIFLYRELKGSLQWKIYYLRLERLKCSICAAANFYTKFFLYKQRHPVRLLQATSFIHNSKHL